MKIKISKTAYSKGFGHAPYKTVHGMSPDEREHCRNGGVVLFNSRRLSGGNHGTPWRIVYARGVKFYHCVPDSDILSAAGIN